MMLRYLLICLGLFYIAGTGLHAAIPAIEREALIALYNASAGDYWIDNPGWKEGTPEPDGFGPVGTEALWFGITILDGHVARINLGSNNLNGSIPAELGNLSNLEELDLTWNQLSGGIPPELANPGNLKTLDLSGNPLSGSIPPELGNLGKLIYLAISFNQL
ncbi:MAG: hypothetical protein GY940_34420, partial [bacterium]|nr:hypothetical protein [bacterium]